MSGKDKDTPTSRSLRSNAVSDEVSMSKIEKLFQSMMNKVVEELESKICSKLDHLLTKVEYIESKLETVKVEQLRVSVELDKVKDIIVEQQRVLERYDKRERLPFLMMSGLTESSVSINGQVLANDMEKVNYVSNKICNTDVDVFSCTRIGKSNNDRPRLLKVGFGVSDHRQAMLRFQSQLRKDEFIKNVFGVIYFNPDSSPLLRKEEYRLRKELAELKQSATERDYYYIKRGILYNDLNVVDRVDIRNQLF